MIKTGNGRTNKNKAYKFILSAIFVIWFAPFLFVAVGSFFSPIENGTINQNSELTIQNYSAFLHTHAGEESSYTSIKISSITTIISLFILYTIGLVYIRFELEYFHILFPALAIQAIPPISILIFFIGMGRSIGLHISGNIIPLLQTLTFIPILLLIYIPSLEHAQNKQSDKTSLIDLAVIDRIDRSRLFQKVVFPASLPSLLLCGLLSFTMSWSEVLFSSYFLVSPESRPLPVLFLSLETTQRMYWGPLYAGLTVTIFILLAICCIAIYVFSRTLRLPRG